MLDHVKSYYNANLWQQDSRASTALNTPAARPKEATAPASDTDTEMPTETEMPEMAPVRHLPSATLSNGELKSKAGV